MATKTASGTIDRVDVRRCARCGGDHKGLEFRALTRPAKDYQWWAPCPENGEPILMDVKPAPGPVRKGGKR